MNLELISIPQTPAFKELSDYIAAHKKEIKKYYQKNSSKFYTVVLLNMHTARCTLAKSPPGTTVGGW